MPIYGARSLRTALYQSRLAHCQLLAAHNSAEGLCAAALTHAQSSYHTLCALLGERELRTLQALVLVARCHIQIALHSTTSQASVGGGGVARFDYLCAGPASDRVSCAQAVQLLRSVRSGVVASYPFSALAAEVCLWLGVALNLLGEEVEARACLSQAERATTAMFGPTSKELARYNAFPLLSLASCRSCSAWPLLFAAYCLITT